MSVAFASSSRGGARGNKDAAQAFAARIVRNEHIVDIPLELCCGALLGRLELRGQIGAFLAAKRNEALAEGKLRALIAPQPRRKIAGAGRVGEGRGIECGLGDTGADMWPRHECGIAEQRNPPEDETRRFEIEDRLEERLGTGKYL